MVTGLLSDLDFASTANKNATIEHWEGRISCLLSAKKIQGLGGLRGLAAGLVVFHHLGGTAARTGNLGVEIFFVLSGFLITTLLLRESADTGTVSLSDFYKRRARRIFPAFYLLWIVSMALAAGRHNIPEYGALIATLLYFTNYYQTLINPDSTFLLHTWSLAVEEQFYLFWPALFKTLRDNLRRLSFVIGILISSAVLWRIFAVSMWPDVVWYTYNAFECRMDQILAGCLLAIALRERWWSRIFAGVCRSPSLLLVTVAGLSFSTRVGADGRWRNTVGFPVEGFLSAILILQVIWFSSQPWLSWMNSKTADYFASISYPLYMWHSTAGAAVHVLLPRSGRIVTGCIAAIISIGLATLSYQVVERRFLVRRV